MELIKTNIPSLDETLGGGLIEDSILLITYDTYSQGWTLAFEILRNRIEEGDFGVIINSVVPLSMLNLELKRIKFDLFEEGEKNRLGVIDIFASFYGIEYQQPYVFYEKMDPETYLPKFMAIYRRMLEKQIKDKRPIGIQVTADGFAFLIGEEAEIRNLQKNLAAKENARIYEKRKRPINITLLNRDRVSQRFLSWISLYSQYQIDFSSQEGQVEEKMFIRKSPLPKFKPTTRIFKLENGKIKII
ncbi:hypothetical protein K1720_08930 [Thermococcus argininiproducens]|uniref:KaiC-like domain-containing protein n=1 Tax=Thermococcus argininiproducens TaxID=2866384 RepID=A0A9E7MAC8_9EURY|nr:hypothetical protein [Thermococcus argininiproducens]USG99616.1 hypothetical protein K1720_08930 [Thermococcus argininiproducens]